MSVEETVVLYDCYFRNEGKLPVSEEKLNLLNAVYVKRAKILGIEFDEKFRNKAGLSMQSACIKGVVTNGEEGLSSAAKVLIDTYNLYNNCRNIFDTILKEFYEKY